MKVNIYIAVDDKQPKKKDRWAGYLIEPVGVRSAGVIETRLVQATANNAVITTMIEALDRFTRPADITMYLDSAFVVRTASRFERTDGRMMNDLEVWQEHSWKTARGTDVKNRKEWQRLYNKLRVFEQSRGTFRFVEMERDSNRRERILQAIKTGEEAV